MADMGAPLIALGEVESGEPFTPQSPRRLNIELSETSVMARSGSMDADRGWLPIAFGMQPRRLIKLERRIEAAG